MRECTICVMYINLSQPQQYNRPTDTLFTLVHVSNKFCNPSLTKLLKYSSQHIPVPTRGSSRAPRRTPRRIRNWTKAHYSSIQAATTSQWIMKETKKTSMSKLLQTSLGISAVTDLISSSLPKHVPRITFKWTTSTTVHITVNTYR